MRHFLSVRAVAVATITGVLAMDVATQGQERNGPEIPPLGLIGYLASSRARILRQHSSHPMLRALAQRLGEPVDDGEPTPAAAVSAPSAMAEPDAVVAGCGASAGTRFNLEPRAAPAVAPQNGTAIDFLPGAGLGGADLVVGSANDVRGLFGGIGDSNTGYYVHRRMTPNPCAADFDGGLPSFPNRLTGEVVFGGGDTALEADPSRSAVFVVDTRFGLTVSTLALFRNTAARLTNAAACPDGTHDGPTAASCWPLHTEVDPRVDGNLNVFPHLAVDPRSIGTGLGAGDVYTSNTLSTLAGVFTLLTACSNSLAACSPAIIISGADRRTQPPHVRVRPDGGITVTYVNLEEGPAPDFQQLYDIKYVTCTPQGAPLAPSCAGPRLIVREDQPVPSRGGGLGGGNLAAANFQITTRPKHEHRVESTVVETYVVWERCKVPNIHGGDKCPDADIRMAASGDNGGSWAFGTVDAGAGDQYFPAIRTDDTSVVNIAYMSAQEDGGMNHRARVLLRQIDPGGATPDPVTPSALITTLAMEPSADFFFGDAFIGSYIGVAARRTASGRHAYVHHTHTSVNGIYNTVPAPEQNNHLSRFDY